MLPLRSYLFAYLSLSFSLSRFPLASFSFLVLSISLSLSLSSPPRCSPCHSLALFFRSYSLPALYFASPFHFHPVPRYLSSSIAAVRVISSRSLFSLLAGRFALVWKLLVRPPADVRSNARSSYIYIRETAIADLCHRVLSIARQIARRWCARITNACYCLDVRYPF